MDDGLSLEALEFRAKDLLSLTLNEQRLRLLNEPSQPTRAPSVQSLAASQAKARANLPALGTFFAEAVVASSLRTALSQYELAWQKNPVGFKGENPLSPRTFGAALAAENNPGRRGNLAALLAPRVIDRQKEARAVVEALRTAGEQLHCAGESLHGVLGLGEPSVIRFAAETAFSCSEDAFLELDRWVRPRLELSKQGPLPWADRLRTTAAISASERLPSADRAGLSTRWLERIEFGEALRLLRDNTRSSQKNSTGIHVLCDGGPRVELVGTPAPGASGLWNYTEAVGTALAFSLGTLGEVGPALRLGQDRMHAGLGSVLARRLWLEPVFLQKEAEIDRSKAEPVLLEALYAELYRLRMDAALALFGLDVLARAPELPGRFVGYMRRAVFDAPEPSWAVHLAALWWEMRPGPRLLGALLEPSLREELREHHDEDWFRNPRSGAELRALFEQLRRRGWAVEEAEQAEKTREKQRAAMRRRIEEAMNVARG